MRVANKQTNLKVVHILPAMNFGGVEVGIKKSYLTLESFFEYRIVTVLFKGKIDCGQSNIFSFLFNIIVGKWRPDVVVTSLWIAHPIGFFLKIFRIKWIAFFHNASFTHYSDEFFLSLAARFSNDCMADSKATLLFMKKAVDRKYNIIPYIFPVENQERMIERNNDFVWIGRNHDQKRLDLICKFIYLLSKQRKFGTVKLIVSGNHYKPFDELRDISGWDIQIFNSIPNNEVVKILSASRFYILLSDFEGMSMSTIEAIQCGCIPIVRPVGEIINYLDDDSAILVAGPTDNDLQKAALLVNSLWDDDEKLDNMQKIAANRISLMGNYCDKFATTVIKQ